jgi:hypothetical protein
MCGSRKGRKKENNNKNSPGIYSYSNLEAFLLENQWFSSMVTRGHLETSGDIFWLSPPGGATSI